MASFYRVPVRVHWADTDAAGIVWFGNYLRYFETAEDELFRALGRRRVDLLEEFDIWLPRVEVACRFRSPARAGDELDVGIAVDMLTERRLVYRFEVRQRATGRLVAEGSYRVACVRRATFAPIEFPEPIRALLAMAADLAAAPEAAPEPHGEPPHGR